MPEKTTLPDVLDPQNGLTVLPPEPHDPIAVPDGAVRLFAHVGPYDEVETSVLLDVDLADLLAVIVPAGVREYVADLLDVDNGDGNDDREVVLLARSLFAVQS